MVAVDTEAVGVVQVLEIVLLAALRTVVAAIEELIVVVSEILVVGGGGEEEEEENGEREEGSTLGLVAGEELVAVISRDMVVEISVVEVVVGVLVDGLISMVAKLLEGVLLCSGYRNIIKTCGMSSITNFKISSSSDLKVIIIVSSGSISMSSSKSESRNSNMYCTRSSSNSSGKSIQYLYGEV